MMNVLELIASRRQSQAPYPDTFKLGLSVEGGGMRGIVSATMLIALQELGMLQVFDSFYGASSGSTNLAYVLSNQPWEGCSIYYDKLATKKFVSPSRLLANRTILDMQYVTKIWEDEVPLDVEAVLHSTMDFVITVSDITHCVGVLKRNFKNRRDLLDALSASVQIPILGGRPVELDGIKYLDGGLFYVDPFYAAIEDGCTHVLALHSRPQDGYPTRLTRGSAFVARLINSMGEGAGDLYLERLLSYYTASRQMGFGSTNFEGVELYRHAVQPNGHSIKRMTTDFGELIRGARTAYDETLQVFSPGSHTFVSFGSVKNRHV